VRPGITFTYLRHPREQAIAHDDEDGKPSANMFAAGEIMAGNVLGKGYAPAWHARSVFGRVAGREAPEMRRTAAAKILERLHVALCVCFRCAILMAGAASAAEPIALRDMARFMSAGVVEISGSRSRK